MNILIRLKKAFLRRLFYAVNGKRFKDFSYIATVDYPSRIEGHKHMIIEDFVYVQSFSWLLALKKNDIDPVFEIKTGVTIGRFSHIVALKKVVIGKNVLIAEKVYISDNTHDYHDISQPIMRQEILHKGDVYIGENSWIGENVSIIGVNIGKHCVIGAHSVVTQNIPDYCVAVGTPAKIIKRYNFDLNKWENV